MFDVYSQTSTSIYQVNRGAYPAYPAIQQPHVRQEIIEGEIARRKLSLEDRIRIKMSNRPRIRPRHESKKTIHMFGVKLTVWPRTFKGSQIESRQYRDRIPQYKPQIEPKHSVRNKIYSSISLRSERGLVGIKPHKPRPMAWEPKKPISSPLRAERGLPTFGSDRRIIERGLKQFEAYERTLFAPAEWGIGLAESLKQQAMEHKARGEHHLGIAKSIAASGVSFLTGMYEGMASILAPWVIARGIYTLATRPGDVARSYVNNPLNISRTLGGIVGGYIVGKVVGRALGKLKTRSQEFLLEKTNTKNLKTVSNIESTYRIELGNKVYKVTVGQFDETGRAVEIPSLGKPSGLVGEYRMTMIRKGDWSTISLEGWKYPGKYMIEKEITYGTRLPIGRGETVFSKSFEAYGVPRGTPYIFSVERVYYGRSLVSASSSIVKPVEISIKRPGLFGRLKYWLQGKKPVATGTYRAVGEFRSAILLGEKLEAGGIVKPQSLVNVNRPISTLVFTPRLTYELGGEFALMGGLSTIKTSSETKTGSKNIFTQWPDSLSLPKHAEAMKPFKWTERKELFKPLSISLDKTGSRTLGLVAPRTSSINKQAALQVLYEMTGYRSFPRRSPRLFAKYSDIDRRWRTKWPFNTRSRKRGYYEEVYPSLENPFLKI